MQNETVLERFKKFKATIISSNIPNSLLMDMIESFIASDYEDTTVTEVIPILDGQMSLSDYELCA